MRTDLHQIKSKIVSRILFTMASVCVPLFSYAAPVQAPQDFKGLVALILGIVQTLTYVVFALTFIAFMWGVVKAWVIKGGDEEAVGEGKRVVTISVIVFVVMGTFWGIVNLFRVSLFGG